MEAAQKDQSGGQPDGPKATVSGSTEFFEVVKSTASASHDNGSLVKACSLYKDGHRLSKPQFAVLDDLWDKYQDAYEQSMGYDEGAREAKNNLGKGIAIAKGQYDGKPDPEPMRA